jgi:hypothetical protein
MPNRTRNVLISCVTILIVISLFLFALLVTCAGVVIVTSIAR